nr:ATP-binding protein [Streptomyces sp. S1D4-11]
MQYRNPAPARRTRNGSSGGAAFTLSGQGPSRWCQRPRDRRQGCVKGCAGRLAQALRWGEVTLPFRGIEREQGGTPVRDRLFEPFQRLGDTDNTTGLGLGLALSRGLTEAMDGTLTPEDTPGGGLTRVLSLPFAERVDLPSDTQSVGGGV